MNEFLKFFDEKTQDFPMHLEITYSKICDWGIYIYKRGCANDYPECRRDGDDAILVHENDTDMELCFAKAHVALKECTIKQIMEASASKDIQEMARIQLANGDKGMYAGYIAALRRDAKVSMFKMAQIAGCSSADYSAYEHERKEFDPEVYWKCKEYLDKVRN